MFDDVMGASAIVVAISLLVSLILFLAICRLFPITTMLREIRDLLMKQEEKKKIDLGDNTKP